MQRPSEVRQQLEQAQMPVDDAPDDEGARQSYNFAPGYHGLVYRADNPNHRGNDTSADEDGHEDDHKSEVNTDKVDSVPTAVPVGRADDTKYKLQAMKWGKISLHLWNKLFVRAPWC